MQQFKGFIPTKNKAPLTTFKNKGKDELLTYKEVKSLPDFAGIIQDGYVLVDIDDEKQSEIMLNIIKDHDLNTKVYRTTRGLHVYFKVNEKCQTNKTNTFTAIGLRIDMKIGTRNSYACMKHNGKVRELIYENGEMEELPKWLSPVSYSFPFLNMEQGEGRNTALFSYILTLQSNGFTKSEIRDTLKIINNYVLEDKLDDAELDSICREDAFSEQIFFGGKNGKTFLIDQFSNFMISEHNIIKLDGSLHIYDSGVYVEGDKRIERLMVQHIPMMRSTERNEVLKYIDILIIEDTPRASPMLIPFKNGIYNLNTDEFEDFSENHILVNKIPHNYNPSSYSKVVDSTLNKLACNSKEIRLLLEEIVGYTFYRSNELRKCFILTGDKRNGKSTYLEMLEHILGRENRSALDLGELGERFKTSQLGGVLANIGDDINDGFIKDVSTFKKLVSGDTVNVERKGADPYDMENYSKLMFSANSIPRMKDETGAVIDRIITVPFNAYFSADDADYNPNIRRDLTKHESLEYMIYLGVQALKGVLKRKAFTESDETRAKLEEYTLENNPIKLFVKESGEDEIIGKATATVYQNYSNFCTINGMHPQGRINFTKALSSELGLEQAQATIEGRRLQAFVKKER